MILAIDPGTELSGVCLFTGYAQNCSTLPNEELIERIVSLCSAQEKLIVAIERIESSFGMPAGKEMFRTAEWVGRFSQCALDRGACVRYLTRLEIKVHVCGSPRAKDANVRAALLDRFGPPGSKTAPGRTYGIHGHEWAALAVAVTAFDAMDGAKKILETL